MTSDIRPEQSIASARASVMIYDDLNKKWVPSGSSHGLSKVHIYHHFLNNTFRVVGRKLQDHEVVINCAILKGLKYNQATPTFHQWRDNKQVYGLNFSSKDDAEIFASAMLRSLEVLNTGGQLALRAAPAAPPPPQQQPQQQPNNRIMAQKQQQQYEAYQPQPQQQQQHHPVYQQPHQHHSANDVYEMYDEYASGSHPNSNHYSDGGYDVYNHQQQQLQQHTQQNEIEMERRLSLQQQQMPPGLHQVQSSPNMAQHITSPISQPPAPPAPPVEPPAAPPAPPAPPPAPPAPPPMMVSAGGVPPPPPPPMPNFGGGGGNEPVSGLAAALQAAKLKKTAKSTENSGGSTTSSTGSSGYGSIGKGKDERPPMASMMDEMQKTLARRRAKVDKGDDEETGDRKNFEKGSSPTGKSSSGSESPKPGRRRFGSTADELDMKTLNGLAETAANNAGMASGASSVELEAMKQEILREMRKEMKQMKQEIIEAIRSEMNRR